MANIPIEDADGSDQDMVVFTQCGGDKIPAVVVGDYLDPDAAAPVTSAQGLRVHRAMSSRSDTYTTATSGTAVNVSSTGAQWFGMQVKSTGSAATAWTVNLQCSLDGTNYATIMQHTESTDNDGDIIWISTPAPALYFRSSVSAITLSPATNIVVTIVGSM
jgi:hypothetical protein